MGLRSFLALSKAITDGGEWKSAKMDKRHFPLSKGRSYKLGAGWLWRIVRLTIDGENCRLLMALHQTKQNAVVMLGREVVGGSNTLLLARLESHASHPGWHVHADCKLHGNVAGRTGFFDERRIPAQGKYVKSADDLLGPDDVAAKAFKTFRLNGAAVPGGRLEI